MDRIENYRRILETIVKCRARFQPANGEIKTHAVCDHTSGEYLVIDSGWNEKVNRIYGVVLYFRLEGETIYVERDTTDAEVIRELLESGIVKADIIWSYNALPFQKLEDLFAS